MRKSEGLFYLLKSKHPDVYKKLTIGAKIHSGAYNKRVSFDEYIGILLAESPSLKSKIQERYPAFITDDDLQQLEHLLTQSKRLSVIREKITGLKKMLPLLNDRDMKSITQRIGAEAYKRLKKNERVGYSPSSLCEILRVYIPKMNIGPFSVRSNDNGYDPQEFIRQNESIFRDYPDIAKKLMKRYHSEQLQKMKNPEEAQRYLEERLS